MIRFFIMGTALTLCSFISFAQETILLKEDSLSVRQLSEVVIITQKSPWGSVSKPLASLEDYLEQTKAVNMIKRGAYAAEPYINGMSSERSLVTIDGMRIYAACTDKMDPITSYVEITNLSRANLQHGQSGSIGATIAGSINLERKKGSFGREALNGTVFSGFESNNKQKIGGGSFSFQHPKFFTNVDFTYRDAGNYLSGGSKEVLYSQFTKYNTSAIVGYKINEHQHVEASLIYDHATDVGYPALTMDVDFAKATIGSIEYIRHHISPLVHQWKTKVYYNNISHRMDDTKRPVVPIRMDMPGWSKTLGFYSLLAGGNDKHTWKANISAHHNSSLAEMTMFSNNPAEKDMFMLTWPGVLIKYVDFFVEDSFSFSKKWTTTISAGLAVHNNVVDNDFGLSSLKIFYPEIGKSKTRILTRASALLNYNVSKWSFGTGLAYGERASSVSEGYGFYLFNSFDQFDYIGNPEVKNEKSASWNAMLGYDDSNFSAKFSGSWFYIKNYIIGRPQPGLSVMTIGAAGVKVYEQLQYAQMLNSSLDLNYQVAKNVSRSGGLIYRRGMAKNIKNLPLIQPLAYSSNFSYSYKTFVTDLTLNASSLQNRFNTEFGETGLPGYAVLNLSASNRFNLGKQSLLLKSGVENLLDKEYTTFADWNRIPRIGRNFFLNAIWNF